MFQSITDDRKLALEIWHAGVIAAHPNSLIPAIWNCLGELPKPTPILVLGGGKAGAAMANALVRSAPTFARLHGIINVPDDQGGAHNEARDLVLHPSRPPGGNLPTDEGMVGSSRQLELAASAPAGTIGICLLSGGASALMPLPAKQISLPEKLETTRLLQRAGADIKILNATRKHLSSIKGGWLAHAWSKSPAGLANNNLWTFAISDVVNDDASVIGSGPTVPDPSTFKSTWDQLKTLGVASLLPKSVIKRFEEGIQGRVAETPKELPDQFPYHMLGNNRRSLEASANRAKNSHCNVQIFPKPMEGPIDGVAQNIVTDIIKCQPIPGTPLVLLWGGEPTVVLPPGSGKGGRNQELALRVGKLLPSEWVRKTTLLCGGTDGEDGPTDAAGGFFDRESLELAYRTAFDISKAIESHSSYEAHKNLGSLLKTGWTGTNVADIVVAIIRA